MVQPKMAFLEKLEAQMANIEVSLSNSSRKKKNINLGSSTPTPPNTKEIVPKNIEYHPNFLNDKNHQHQTTQLNSKFTTCNITYYPNNLESTNIDKNQSEIRLKQLQLEISKKEKIINDYKMALKQLEITDNIDLRIQQAELEFQLGQEELDLLTLIEELRAFQVNLDKYDNMTYDYSTLYSCIFKVGKVLLLGMEVEHDSKNPKFFVTENNSLPGLWIDQASENTKIRKGDRLIEVNGKIVLTYSKAELERLLLVSPYLIQLVVLRKVCENEELSENANNKLNATRSELELVRKKAELIQKTNYELKSDNIRLTHRIFYLEDQVSELLNSHKISNTNISLVSCEDPNKNITNINISPQSTIHQANLGGNSNSEDSFQKRPKLTTSVPSLLLNETSKIFHNNSSLINRSSSSLSNVPSTITSYSIDGYNYKRQKSFSKKRYSAINNLDQTEISMNHKYKRNSHIKNKEDNNCHRVVINYEKIPPDDTSSNVMDQNLKKATKIIKDLTKNKDNNNCFCAKHRQKYLTASEMNCKDILKHHNARKSNFTDFKSEYFKSNNETPRNIGKRLFQKIQIKPSKPVEIDSDSTSIYNSHHNKRIDYTSEPITDTYKLVSGGSKFDGNSNCKCRLTPPKKSLRSYLQKTRSLQSVQNVNAIPNYPVNCTKIDRLFKGK